MPPNQKNHTRELTRIEQLLDTYNFKEALQAVETLEHQNDLSPPDRLTCHLLKSRLMNNLGQFEETLKLTEAIIRESQRRRKRLHKVDALIARTEALGFLGRFEEGFDAIKQGEHELAPLTRDQPAEVPQRTAALLHWKGFIYLWKGEIDRAREYGQKSLVLREKLGHKLTIAQSLVLIGWIYNKKGELDRALEYTQQSLAVAKDLGIKRLIAWSLNSIGNMYWQKGELGRALEYGQQSLALFEELGATRAPAYVRDTIGVIYHQKGEMEQAVAHLEQSLALAEEIGPKFLLAYPLFHLISVVLDTASLDRAQQYLQRLQQLHEQDPDNKVISQMWRVAEALVLKTSTRARHRVKAEELLEQVAEEEVVDHEVTVVARLNLCDLLLTELSVSGDPEVLGEVLTNVTRLREIAIQQHSHWLLAETYVLQAKLALVEQNVQDARRILEQAQQIAEERGLQRLAMRISTEHDTLLDQLDQWQDFIDRNVSLVERADLAHLEEQVVRMIRKRVEELPELPKEDPVLVLIIGADSGLSVFSKAFHPDRPLAEHLIAGFLTAINAFGRDAFAVTGSIE